MKKKIVLIALFLVFLGSLIWWVTLASKRTPPVKPKPSGKISPPPSPVSKLIPRKAFSAQEIAKISLAFLDQQKRNDGFYHYFTHPQRGKKNMFEQANMWTLLARLSFYQNFSHQPQDLAQAEQDAQALMSFCSQDPKKCRGVLVPFTMLYAETQKEEYKNLLENIGQLLLKESYGKGVMSLAAQARELARLYELFPDQRYLEVAQQRLSEAKLVSENDQATLGLDDEICHLVLAQTEMARITGNQEMLGQTTRFFKENKETTVPGEMTLIQPCIESLLVLGQLTDDWQIKAKGLSLLDQLVTARWDGPGLNRSYQEGGFFMGEDKRLINITDTAYMIYLLGFEPSKTYTFRE